MHVANGVLLLSATDLTDYLACEHLTQLELAAARGALARPSRDDPSLDVVSRRGLEHEQRYLAALRARGLGVVTIPWSGADLASLKAAHAATLEALQAGADVVYQAALFDGRWRGYADFLFRVDGVPSALGRFSYEVADAKLAHHLRAGALLQMCHYAEQLELIQGHEPARIHVVLGTGERKAHRLRDYSAYYRHLKRRFERVVDGPPQPTYPHPVEHCAVCTWSDVCAARRQSDDHLSQVANIRRDQVKKLQAHGIATVEQLAQARAQVPGIGHTTFDRLRQQARLQVHQRANGRVTYELLPAAPGQGLALLPTPSPGDIFFDIEGDPYVEDGGLEYLFGVVELDQQGQPAFRAFWAHDRAQEKLAFEAFIDHVCARLERHPDLHVYHYAPYEPTALKRLMGEHATREAEVDRLLRGGVLVDLYQVVRQGLRCSQESYSIKKLEPLYMEAREGAIKDAGSSVVAYEQWLQTQDRAILDEIAAYNRDDCVSTWKLRDWLEARRLELAEITGSEVPRPAPRAQEPGEAQAEAEAHVEALVQALTADVPPEREERTEEQQGRWLLAQLLSWHRREEKPEWWAYFDRCSRSEEELFEDTDALGGLSYAGVVGEVKQSVVHRYRFDPAQEHRIAVGSSPHDPRTGKAAGTVVALDNTHGSVDLKRGRTSAIPHPTALIPPPPIDSRVLRRALHRLADWVVEHGIEAPGPYRAARDLLLARPPRVAGHRMGEPLLCDGEGRAEAARRLVAALEASYLPIQGPPGSGKTYTAARMVVDLVGQGRRVGICAFSHRAISNLLDAVAEHAQALGMPLRALQKASGEERCASPLVQATESNAEVEQALASGAVDVVAGTAWLFARERLIESVDVLFVDEAGQLSLANTLAIAGAARSLVLLGDPRQLSQPSRGSHPPGAEKSALEHVLGEHATMPPERGLLLDTTWRMHPAICAFISDVAYDNRLRPHATCATQALAEGEALGGVGLRYLPIPHESNHTSSLEEAQLVARTVQALLGRVWTDQRGRTRALTLDDILVVAPYNAQVAMVATLLPAGARVGTVDRFQGQEAPVVLFTTAASSAEDAPRGLEFLFSLNRLNVAISRARGLAALVASPALLQVRCRTPEQMRLVNAFCRLVEAADEQAANRRQHAS